MFQYTLEELKALKKSTDILRELEFEDRFIEPLTDELLSFLVTRHKNNLKNSVHYDNDSLFQQSPMSMCGCIGPIGGEPYCNCAMSRLRYMYRFDIALAILNSDDHKNIITYYSDEYPEDKFGIVIKTSL